MGSTADNRIDAKALKNLDIFRVIHTRHSPGDPKIGPGKLAGYEVILVVAGNRNQDVRMES